MPEASELRPKNPFGRLLRVGVRLGGGIALVLLLGISALAFAERVSPWTHGYLMAFELLCGALVVRRPAWPKRLGAVGSSALVLTAIARALTVPAPPGFSVIALPSGARSVLSKLVPEKDGALLAARALGARDGGELLTVVIRDAYTRMDGDVGEPATPAIRTYLGLQSPRAFDTIIIEPDMSKATSSAILFLHGFAGSFDVYCWHLSRAARRMLVVCPSMGPFAEWWTLRGLVTVEKTLDYLRARHIRHVYLAGLSNGARGAAALAPRIASEIDGLILISGTDPRETAPDLPLLVIQGEQDGMMPAKFSREYSERGLGPHEYVPLPGGHFVFFSRTIEVTRAMEAWLRERAQTEQQADQR